MFTMDRRLVAAIVALALVLWTAGTVYLQRDQAVSASAGSVLSAGGRRPGEQRQRRGPGPV